MFIVRIIVTVEESNKIPRENIDEYKLLYKIERIFLWKFGIKVYTVCVYDFDGRISYANK